MPVELVTNGDPDAPKKTAIVTCTLGNINSRHMIMRIASGLPLGQRNIHVNVVEHGIEDARNIGASIAELQGWEYLVFWDDDVVPHQPGPTDMLVSTMDQNPEIDILGGVYPARQVVPSPIVIKERFGSPWWGFEDGGIHKVWMTGTGLTAYRISSMRKLEVPVIEVANPFYPNGPRTFPRPRWFSMEGNTDDYNLATLAEEQGLNWYVHGGVTADQMDSDRRLFEFSKARQRIAKEEAIA